MADPTTYQSYKGLPSLAGLCTMKQATLPGISVEECVRRLKRFHYAFKRLHEIFTKRLIAEPVYELKMAFSHHAYLSAEHAAGLRTRVAEMREPPLGLEDVPDPHLEIFFDEILASTTTEELVTGLYQAAIPALQRGFERHLADTNRIVDAPTVRLARFALLELEDMAEYGRQAVASLVGPQKVQRIAPWVEYLTACLQAAGDLDGVDAPSGRPGQRRYSTEPYIYDKVPRRDERFFDLYNMGVNAEAFIYDERFPARAKILMLYYKRLREIDVPEMMASILAETPDKPWEYYHDMSRQLWDEARHAMMGEIGFASLGLDWSKLVPINFTFSYVLNTQVPPLQRHAVLYFIEQGLMPRTGKRFEWEIAGEAGEPLAQTMQDYDWADEVLHARIGRQWYVSVMPSQAEAKKLGDLSWSRGTNDWEQWRKEGLTSHRNWWPDLYRAACAAWGIEPDEQVLAFDTSYEEQRADLKRRPEVG